MKGIKKIGTLIIAIVFLFACDSDKQGSMSCLQDYDLTLLLNQMANENVDPAYENFASSALAMQMAANDLMNDKSLETLQTLRQAFEQCYLDYIYAAFFVFGPAEQLGFRERVNSFPLNLGQLTTSIENENYEFNTSGQFDQGLPALDYFLYGTGASDAEILEALTSDQKVSTYLLAVVEDLRIVGDQTLEEWKEIKPDFINDVGTSAGSSFSNIINSWNEEYEYTKRERIGIPSGALTLGFANPDKVESFYSGISLDLIRASMQAAEQIFKGISAKNGEDGEGMEDLLNYVNAEREGQSLSEVITNQYDQIENDLNELSELRFSDLVQEEQDKVNDLYISASQQVLYQKTDLASMLCVAITYVDNPSDSD